MKFNELSGTFNHSNLLEISRKHLVSKTKVLSPERYGKRLFYNIVSPHIKNTDNFIKTDVIVVEATVGDYVCTVQFYGVIKHLVNIVGQQPKHNITLQSVIRAVTKAIDFSDVYVNCTCGDFKYRFAYYATKFKYKYGEPELRPPKIRNPHDSKGAVCKHLTLLLYNKRWLASIASDVSNIIKSNLDDIRKRYKIPEDMFYLSKSNKRAKPVKSIDIEEED